MIYFYTSVNKTGEMWSNGTAVYYMYQLETFLTPMGEWIAQFVGSGLSNIMTGSTLPMEIYASFAILCPVLQPWLRRIALVIFIGFHGIIAISVNIGLFSWVMLAAIIFLISWQDMDLLSSLLSRCYKRKYTVFYDRDCGFCHFTARILRRMDVFSCLTWADRLTEGNKPKNVDKLLETTIVVWDPIIDELWTRHKGFSKIISALPLGFLIAWIFRIPGLEKFFGYIYDLIANNRTVVSKTIGLPACGIEQNETSNLLPKEENLLIRKSRTVIWVISNVLVLTLLIGAVDYSTKINVGLKSHFSKEEKKLKKSNQKVKFQGYRRTMKRILLSPPYASKMEYVFSQGYYI
jgi:predicted DCC family thiol-disulfide oxidoreductase YuxK